MAGPILLNEKTFKIIIIVLISVALAMVALIFGMFVFEQLSGNKLPVIDNKDNPDDETGPWGYKNFEWDYLDIPCAVGVEITKTTYKSNNEPFGGTDIPKDLINYVVAYDSDNAVNNIARQLSEIAYLHELDDEKTINLVISFINSIEYLTDSETGHSRLYPRSPVVTIAEQRGDSEDLTVLASAILECMGYSSAIYYYPPTYDRGSIIPQACALAIPGYSHEGPVYSAVTTYDKSNLTFEVGKSNKDAIPSGQQTSVGWYSGNGIWTAGNLTGSLSNIIYMPETGEFTADGVPQIGKESIKITIENASWILPAKVMWTVDTSKYGIGKNAYNSIKPVLSQSDAFWYGREIDDSSSKDILDLDLVFDLGFSNENPGTMSYLSYSSHWDRSSPFTAKIEPVISVNDMSPQTGTEIWRYEADRYLQSSWYSSGISWVLYDDWKLYDKFLTIKEIPAILYTPNGTAEHVTQVPWRVSYSINGIYKSIDLDRDGDYMSPYASLFIAVYEITDANTVELVELTGWQGNNNAETYGYSKPYSPGRYAIGIFSRNAEANVNIEYYGKQNIDSYIGGI